MLHDWHLSPEDAQALQADLAPHIDTQTPLDIYAVQTVAGVDVSVKDGQSRAAVVVLGFPLLEIIEARTAHMPTPFPYVPGLLSFREGEVILQAEAQLTQRPDVYLFDGMAAIPIMKMSLKKERSVGYV